MKHKKHISFVLPVFNEVNGLDKLYERLQQVVAVLNETYSTEIIFVNDGSTDGSTEKLYEIYERNTAITIINFSRNFGHQIAVTAGLDFAHGDAVIVMDADLQDPPEVAMQLLEKWEEGYAVVYAQRRSRKDTYLKKITAHVFYRLLDTLSTVKIPKDTGDFRLMDRKVVDALQRFQEKNRYMRGMVSFVGYKQTGVQFDRSERYVGTSHYTFSKMIQLAFDALTSFSTRFLTSILQVGLGLIVVSVLGILLVFGQIVTSHVSFPWMGFLFLALCFFSGMQLTSFGIVGMYIGRIYTEVQNRPLYIVESLYTDREEKLITRNDFARKVPSPSGQHYTYPLS